MAQVQKWLYNNHKYVKNNIYLMKNWDITKFGRDDSICIFFWIYANIYIFLLLFCCFGRRIKSSIFIFYNSQ